MVETDLTFEEIESRMKKYDFRISIYQRIIEEGKDVETNYKYVGDAVFNNEKIFELQEGIIKNNNPSYVVPVKMIDYVGYTISSFNDNGKTFSYATVHKYKPLREKLEEGDIIDMMGFPFIIEKICENDEKPIKLKYIEWFDSKKVKVV